MCEITVNTALLARIEMLEKENAKLKQGLQTKKPFRLDDISYDARLVRFYTGFSLYQVLLAFFDFLGPSVDHLH